MATKTRELADFILEEGIGGDADIAIQGAPHIQPGVLHPSYVASGTSNKLLDGSTDHSGAFGTAQSDGRSYYYTNIAGSKPIKDPRIGAHFGSQRYKFSSLQLLKQETATHGYNVYSVDGREYMRAASGTQNWQVVNDAAGVHFTLTAASSNAVPEFIEVVAYANMCNYQVLGNYSGGNSFERFDVYVDGTLTYDNPNSSPISVSGPNRIRYVVGGQTVSAISSGVTLGLHTFKFQISPPWTGNAYMYATAIELIAQDTTSTATKSQIQIPAQTVVSYGKKFDLSAAAHHYNPFAFKTDGTTAWTSGNHNGTAWPVGTGSSTNIDTATSLGLAAWVSTNYYYPYNGGRVVKWIASDGTIKTSVNMMPPNARNMHSTAFSEKGDDSAGTTSAAVANNTYLPTFTDQAIDHSQTEVAKLFHAREFGNGAANGGTGSTYADASMLRDSIDTIAYVMDDGLTSLSAKNARCDNSIRSGNRDEELDLFVTFIGTGFSCWYYADNAYNSDIYVDGIKIEDASTASANRLIEVQNLPYGTHIIRFIEIATTNDNPLVFVKRNDMSFFQPKMPPIPENAVVIADYMLMADFVPQTASGIEKVSKGVRSVNASRDCWYDKGSASGSFDPVSPQPLAMGGLEVSYDTGGQSAGLIKQRLPFFGTNFVSRNYNHSTRASISLDGTTKTGGDRTINGDTNRGSYAHLTTSVTLGSYLSGKENAASQNPEFNNMDIVTPIHTSSHYQTFETPFLHELVGGDRNMEQTNLVVTPDGKTWDAVSRDTNYIGNVVLNINSNATQSSFNGVITWDKCRGQLLYGDFMFNKDFALAYDSQICLREGLYQFTVATKCTAVAGGNHINLSVNGTIVKTDYPGGNAENFGMGYTTVLELKRGDVIRLGGRWLALTTMGQCTITRV